jgi:hypothetical protein
VKINEKFASPDHVGTKFIAQDLIAQDVFERVDDPLRLLRIR